MNKLLVSVVAGAFLVAAVGANAQSKMSLGFKGGLAMATMTGEDTEVPDGAKKVMRLGMDIGAAFNMGFSDMMGLTIEANYAQKGMKMAADEESADNYLTMKLDYIDIPVLLRITPSQGSVAPYILVGPQLSINASAKMGGKMLGEKVDDEDIEDIAGIDFGVAAGVGVGIPAGPGKFVVEYRFGLGFLTADGSDADEKADMKNMVPATIRAGFLVDL